MGKFIVAGEIGFDRSTEVSPYVDDLDGDIRDGGPGRVGCSPAKSGYVKLAIESRGRPSVNRPSRHPSPVGHCHKSPPWAKRGWRPIGRRTETLGNFGGAARKRSLPNWPGRMMTCSTT